MEATFKLDTGGSVFVPISPAHVRGYRWSDLSPFEQGYVEALLQSCDFPVRNAAGTPLREGDPLPGWMRARFSDLSPEALATILRDCAEECAVQTVANSRYSGLRFWQLRQDGRMRRTFPPLTVALTDDGKIALTNKESL